MGKEYQVGLKFKNKVSCEGCDSQSATLVMMDLSPHSFRVECSCGWNELVEGLDEFFWYLSDALNIDENSLVKAMLDKYYVDG